MRAPRTPSSPWSRRPPPTARSSSTTPAPRRWSPSSPANSLPPWFRCRPSRCGRLSRPRTTPAAPSQRRANGRRRACPGPAWTARREGMRAIPLRAWRTLWIARLLGDLAGACPWRRRARSRGPVRASRRRCEARRRAIRSSRPPDQSSRGSFRPSTDPLSW